MSHEPGRPLRILQVFNRYLQPGGEEKSVARMAQDLAGAGHEVTRFWRESAEWSKAGAPPKWKRPLLLWSNASVLEGLQALHQKTRPDFWLLHNVLPVVSLGVYWLARRLNVPIVQWLHNYRPLSPSGTLLAGGKPLAPDDPWIAWKEIRAGTWHGPFLTAWLAWSYRRLKRQGDFEAVRAWVAISEEMKTVFRRANWFPKRLHALRHCWHIQTPAPSQSDDGSFLFLGRLVEAKGVRFLVDLWGDAAFKSTPLTIAGQGDLVEQLRAQTPPQVRWVGHVEGEAKRDLLARCRAVLLPHLWDEPLGLVSYEAFEMGKTVLASNLGGLKEIVQDDRTGRLLEPGNAAVWREAILGLQAAQARQLGLAGRKWLEENTSPDHWNRQFAAIARQALSAS